MDGAFFLLFLQEYIYLTDEKSAWCHLWWFGFFIYQYSKWLPSLAGNVKIFLSVLYALTQNAKKSICYPLKWGLVPFPPTIVLTLSLYYICWSVSLEFLLAHHLLAHWDKIHCLLSLCQTKCLTKLMIAFVRCTCARFVQYFVSCRNGKRSSYSTNRSLYHLCCTKLCCCCPLSSTHLCVCSSSWVRNC